jgi:cytochrome bd-type quinol oxidase subunit 1
MDDVLLSGIQFALTVGFHHLFPSFTKGSLTRGTPGTGKCRD